MYRRTPCLKPLGKFFEQPITQWITDDSNPPKSVQGICFKFKHTLVSFSCPNWPFQMIALCTIPVLLSRHIKEFTDLHIEASASGCNDLLLCHGSYPFFNIVFPRETTDPVTSCMSVLSLLKGLKIQGSGLFFKDFCYRSRGSCLHQSLFFFTGFIFLLQFCNISNVIVLNHKFIIHLQSHLAESKGWWERHFRTWILEKLQNKCCCFFFVKLDYTHTQSFINDT